MRIFWRRKIPFWRRKKNEVGKGGEFKEKENSFLVEKNMNGGGKGGNYLEKEIIYVSDYIINRIKKVISVRIS